MSIEIAAQDQSSQYSDPFRIAFFGRRCRLTQIPLERIIATRHKVAAILLPSPMEFGPMVRGLTTRERIPIGVNRPAIGRRTIDQLAYDNDVPMFGIRNPLGTDLEQVIRDIVPDLIIVSCFPWKIPSRVFGHATHGAVNLHPSLLPQFRGPDPLFWAYQTGAHEWGASIHQLDDAFDRGPVLGQTRFEITDGMDGDELENLAAERGASLLVEVVEELQRGTITPEPQSETSSSYYSFPGQRDLTVSREWTVRRAMNFVQGIIPLGHSPLVETQEGIFETRHARLSDQAATPEDETWIASDVVRIELEDGGVEFATGKRIDDD